MRLEYFSPSPFVRDLFTVHFALSEVDVSMTECVPALLANIHVRLSGSTRYHFGDGRWVVAPPVSVVGPTSSSFEMVLSPGTRVLGIGLLPLGWRRCMGEGADGMADRLVDAEAIWPASVIARTLDQIASGPLDGRHVPLVEQLVLHGQRTIGDGDAARVRAIDRWIESRASPHVDALGEVLGLSVRQIGRLTLDLHGCPPKLLAMKYRALRTASRLTGGGLEEMQAVLANYADQSHMIRDFRRFTGWTPAAFARDRRALARATMQGRLDAGLSRPLALWS